MRPLILPLALTVVIATTIGCDQNARPKSKNLVSAYFKKNFNGESFEVLWKGLPRRPVRYGYLRSGGLGGGTICLDYGGDDQYFWVVDGHGTILGQRIVEHDLWPKYFRLGKLPHPIKVQSAQ